MRYINVGSGSSGNSTIIYNADTTILIDCGVSRKRIFECLKTIGRNFEDVDALLITHLHQDHIGHMDSLKPELALKTYGGEKEILDPRIADTHVLQPFQDFAIKSFWIKALPTSHDTPHPLGYLIKDLNNKTTLLYMTDTGYVPFKDINLAKDLTYYILESNHNPEMLMKSDRNNWLKMRILGDHGHLSNEQSSHSLSLMIGKDTKEVALAHLSHECNTPELAINTFHSVMKAQLGYIPNVILKVLDPKKPTSGGDLVLEEKKK